MHEGLDCHRVAFGVYSRHFSSRQIWGEMCLRTRFAIRLRLICSRAAQISDRSKSFSGTRAFPQPSVIPKWTWGDLWKCTIALTHEAELSIEARLIRRASEGILSYADHILAQCRRIHHTHSSRFATGPVEKSFHRDRGSS